MSSPFQLSGCSALPFAPKLTASTTGHGSRVNGTNFNVKLESAGLGQANIHKVLLTIPRELPSRLPTLQKACPEAKFNAGPQNCPSESIIGHATVHTPVLRSALTGPAYLVSHGNAGFPDVEFVLQGEGVTLVLDGKTDIKNGVTYSRFETAPDAPFTTFETELPAGPHSILAAFTSSSAADPYNICGRKLEMPTEITAQNGAVIRETTKIKALGCGGVASFRSTRAQKLARPSRRVARSTQRAAAGLRKAGAQALRAEAAARSARRRRRSAGKVYEPRGAGTRRYGGGSPGMLGNVGACAVQADPAGERICEGRDEAVTRSKVAVAIVLAFAGLGMMAFASLAAAAPPIVVASLSKTLGEGEKKPRFHGGFGKNRERRREAGASTNGCRARARNHFFAVSRTRTGARDGGRREIECSIVSWED